MSFGNLPAGVEHPPLRLAQRRPRRQARRVHEMVDHEHQDRGLLVRDGPLRAQHGPHTARRGAPCPGCTPRRSPSSPRRCGRRRARPGRRGRGLAPVARPAPRRTASSRPPAAGTPSVARPRLGRRRGRPGAARRPLRDRRGEPGPDLRLRAPTRGACRAVGPAAEVPRAGVEDLADRERLPPRGREVATRRARRRGRPATRPPGDGGTGPAARTGTACARTTACEIATSSIGVPAVARAPGGLPRHPGQVAHRHQHQPRRSAGRRVRQAGEQALDQRPHRGVPRPPAHALDGSRRARPRPAVVAAGAAPSSRFRGQVGPAGSGASWSSAGTADRSGRSPPGRSG